MKIMKQFNGVTVDTHSVEEFVTLAKKEEWSDKDLEQFVSTKGIQYLIQQEKDTGPNVDEETIKDYLKSVKQNISGEVGGWEIAFKEKRRIEKRIEYMDNRWNYLVERPYAVVKDYLPPITLEKSTFYVLPGGVKESYSDENGFAINVGRGALQDTHFMYLFAKEAYRHHLLRLLGRETPIKACKTPVDFFNTFFSITRREGIAAYVGLKAAGTQEQFLKDVDVERISVLYSEAFQLALDGKAPAEADRIEKDIFCGLTSPSTIVGVGMAKALDTFMSRSPDPTFGKATVIDTLTKERASFFFEMYTSCQKDSLLSEVVRDAVKISLRKNGFVNEQKERYFMNNKTG